MIAKKRRLFFSFLFFTCMTVQHAVQDENDKVVVCERGDLVFVFNFHPTKSYKDYGVGCKNAGSYKVGHLQVHTLDMANKH